MHSIIAFDVDFASIPAKINMYEPLRFSVSLPWQFTTIVVTHNHVHTET